MYLLFLCRYIYCFYIDVFIGFLSRTYRANEVDGEVILEVGIITGSQQDDIIITILITLTNGTASRKLMV